MSSYWCVGYDGEEAVSGTSVMTVCHHDAAEAVAEDLFMSSDGQWPGGRIEVTDQASEVRKIYDVAITIGDPDSEGEADVILEVQEVES